MESESGVCVLCDLKENLLKSDVTLKVLRNLTIIFNRKSASTESVDELKLCSFCAGKISQLLNFHDAHVRGANPSDVCFVCGTRDLLSMYFSSENSSPEFINVVKTFEEAFYKKYERKDLICCQCTFMLKCWNDMLNVVLSKNLVEEILPAKVIKKVSFSPTKQYIESGRTSPLKFSPTTSESNAIEPESSPDSPRTTGRRRKRLTRKPIKLQLKHLKTVTLLVKGRGKKISLNDITDDRILNEVPYISINANSQISEDIINSHGSPNTPANVRKIPTARKKLLDVPEPRKSEGESFSNDDDLAVVVEPESSEEDEQMPVLTPAALKGNSRKPIPKLIIKSKFKISNLIFKPSANVLPIILTPASYTCKMCNKIFKYQCHYKLHTFKHKHKKELRIVLCKEDIDILKSSMCSKRESTNFEDSSTPQLSGSEAFEPMEVVSEHEEVNANFRYAVERNLADRYGPGDIDCRNGATEADNQTEVTDSPQNESDDKTEITTATKKHKARSKSILNEKENVQSEKGLNDVNSDISMNEKMDTDKIEKVEKVISIPRKSKRNVRNNCPEQSGSEQRENGEDKEEDTEEATTVTNDESKSLEQTENAEPEEEERLDSESLEDAGQSEDTIRSENRNVKVDEKEENDQETNLQESYANDENSKDSTPEEISKVIIIDENSENSSIEEVNDKSIEDNQNKLEEAHDSEVSTGDQISGNEATREDVTANVESCSSIEDMTDESTTNIAITIEDLTKEDTTEEDVINEDSTNKESANVQTTKEDTTNVEANTELTNENSNEYTTTIDQINEEGSIEAECPSIDDDLTLTEDLQEPAYTFNLMEDSSAKGGLFSGEEDASQIIQSDMQIKNQGKLLSEINRDPSDNSGISIDELTNDNRGDFPPIVDDLNATDDLLAVLQSSELSKDEDVDDLLGLRLEMDTLTENGTGDLNKENGNDGINSKRKRIETEEENNFQVDKRMKLIHDEELFE